jgi:formylmethanofuran dehydrogenase subunit C
MEGGKIIVNGNAGEKVGDFMNSGEIRIEGEYESLTDYIKGGKIYHKRKLIFPRR